MLKEFKKFAFKGNVMDMAIGVIVGSAFSTIVTSLVNDIIMPLIGVLTGGFDISGLKLTLGADQLNEAGEVVKAAATLNYGAFLQNIINFLIVALSLFFAMRLINRLHDIAEKELHKHDAAKEEPEQPVQKPDDVLLLEEIRDLLKAGKQPEASGTDEK